MVRASCLQVVNQLGHGYLSEENRKYLHGEPVEGCRLSVEERRSRKRVIDGPEDPRLQEAKYQTAPVNVAHNDARCQINKDRAEKYSADAGLARPRWSLAVDIASSKALQADACDKDAKIRRGSTHCRP